MTVPQMTRFLLSLEQAVDTVITAIREAKAGETYVPRAPSATVFNIAKALIGNQTIEIRETGIRPGEKMHEIMVSEEEANHCVARGDYYAICRCCRSCKKRKMESRWRYQKNTARPTRFSILMAPSRCFENTG